MLFEVLLYIVGILSGVAISYVWSYLNKGSKYDKMLKDWKNETSN